MLIPNQKNNTVWGLCFLVFSHFPACSRGRRMRAPRGAKPRRLPGNLCKRERNLPWFLPIKEGNCFYPARRAEILPSPEPKKWGFQQNPQGCRIRLSSAKSGQQKQQSLVCPRHRRPGMEQVGTWSPAVPLCTRTTASRGGKREGDNY